MKKLQKIYKKNNPGSCVDRDLPLSGMNTNDAKKQINKVSNPPAGRAGFGFRLLAEAPAQAGTSNFHFASERQIGLAQSVNIRGCVAERKVPTFLSPRISTAGFSLVEILLATALFALLVTAFAGVYKYGIESSVLSGNRARAVVLAQEGIEAVRNIKDQSYTNLISGTHGLKIVSGAWSFVGASDVQGIFTRSIVITNVDTKRKNVVVNVVWQQNQQRLGSVSLHSRFTSW